MNKNTNFIVTTEQMRIAENNAVQRGVSLRTLAENAALSCYNYISEIVGDVETHTFTILCGKGMNGGDGILIASLLKQARAEVLCIFVDDVPNTGLAGEIYSLLAPTLITSSYKGNEDAVKYTLQNTHVIIDCVLGFGFSGTLEAHIADLFDFINTSCKNFGEHNYIKFSVDLPSGVDAFVPDTILVLGAYKKVLLSRNFPYVILDIGLIPEDYTQYEAKFTEPSIHTFRPKRSVNSHKGSYGKLLNIAGSERYIGAAFLSTKAAIKTGAGLVTLSTSQRVIQAVASAIPEAIFTHTDTKSLAQEIEIATAISIGCGLGNNSGQSEVTETRKIVEFVICNATCPIILDADGINSICDNINVLKDNDKLIITPHPAEFARLTGLTVTEIQSNRIDYAKIFAKESNAIIVLKGVNTVIASPNGAVTVNPTGNAGLAKAGTGDVLTGIIASLATQGIEPYEAAVLGVYLHGLAADELAKTKPLHGITASEIADMVGNL